MQQAPVPDNLLACKLKLTVQISHDEKWQAVINCDEAYNGLFFYGVKTTGIFCRPSCRAKVPLRSNVVIRLFKQHTGLTPVQYISKLKVDKASELLGQTDVSVLDRKKPNTGVIIGIILGFCGIAVMVMPQGGMNADKGIDTIGIIALLFAAFSWSIGSLYSRSAVLPESPLLSTAMQMIGVPHEWDQERANPTFGHSIDAYNEVSIAAARLTSFIKSLGYAARPHCPDTGYEVIIPPILVDAGVGEQGRFGFVVTPEFGANFRPAVVTTNLPLKPDKPIDIGVREFCETCKICAETCPSESISFDGPKEIRGRGFDGWQIDIETCHNYWMSVPGSDSCRICLAVCPFSRKSNWLHTTARNVAVRDKTGVVHSSLTWMEKTFYGQHEAAHFVGPEWGTFRKPPWWFDTERFINVKKS
ncbi:reductive dehalogenase [Desulfitibacter alkalitolerans]|uniref:reductive dehalogenase n=1 Tax=Desulfitibacter alkalitolerans TaxID=264641 RepID=UPI000685FBE0|nr:reductive dehalogenase [Desulfitibacter alkalitolerans]